MEFQFSAGAIIYRYNKNQREYLFLKRSSKSYDLPKGIIEKGEDSINAATREVKEETDLDVKFIPFFKGGYSFMKTENKMLVKKHVTVFLAKAPEKEVRVSWEHKDYKWITISEAKAVLYKDMIPMISEADTYINRIDMMETVNKKYKELPEKEKEWNLSRNFVAGEGPLNARVMLIGQAPGNDEDKTGRPFVGRSGKLLDRLIHIAGLRREKIYITSMVQFFPPENRIPTKEEVTLCKPLLERQIEIISPEIIVLVGSLASSEFAGVHGIMKDHGKIIMNDNQKYFVTLHPAAAVRIKSNMPLIENDFRNLKKIIKEITA